MAPPHGVVQLLAFHALASTWRTGVEKAPPTKGEHTREILNQAGMKESEIETLVKNRVGFSPLD